ncbi:transmembrane and TPR repeat-containing protein CG31690-like [Anoplophora glabripennis]|uniref:transmembrane and TPR repeat-containing protein CG31690-like n=1 Tax=Anoplophora glabripennis TaxID=217634 RepID=UPI000C762540|nr:transmembrane and TPR repeat-containing protein CG31690-like [Anoplophora glabripennis]
MLLDKSPSEINLSHNYNHPKHSNQLVNAPLLFQKQTHSLLILASALSIILAVRLQTRTPQFSTADNPTAREAEFLTRFLTFSYLPVFNFWLLIFPNTLSFDWGMDAIPRITTIRDGRNALSFAFYFGLGQTLVRIVRSLKKHKPKKFDAVKEVDRNLACTVCHLNFHDVHSSSCRNTNNNNATNFQSTSCVCLTVNQRIKLANRTDKKQVSASGAILLSVAFLALPFLPATNILFYVGFVVAERVLYISSAGLCLLLGLASATFWNSYRKHRVVSLFSLVIVLVAFSAKTVCRNRDWHDEESLYRSAIPVNPPKAYGNLGSVLSSQGRVAEAEWAFRKALQFRPNMADVHYNL